MAKRLTPEEKAAREAAKVLAKANREALRSLKANARDAIKAQLKNDLLYLTNVRKDQIEAAVQTLSDARAELKQSKLAEKQRLRDQAKADLLLVKSLTI
jgi:hypothetical protein